MKKGIVITGKAQTGKTLLAKEIASQYKQDEIFTVDGKTFERNINFIFNGINKNVKCIIFDDLSSKISLGNFLDMLSNEIRANQKHKGILTINPEKIILVFDESFNPSSFPESFKRRLLFNIELK